MAAADRQLVAAVGLLSGPVAAGSAGGADGMAVWRLMLIAILVIFASRFAAGAMAAVAPGLLEKSGMAELFVALPGFCAGLMAARALAQAGCNRSGRAREQLTAEAEC